MSKNGQASEFLVVVHNPRPHNHTQFVRVKLPSSSYRAQIWTKTERDFVDLGDYDILEQMHFKNSKQGQNETFSDYEMFISQIIGPNSVEVFKILAVDQPFQFPEPGQERIHNPMTLEVAGFTDNNEALFHFVNRDQDMTQGFGVSLKYYKS